VGSDGYFLYITYGSFNSLADCTISVLDASPNIVTQTIQGLCKEYVPASVKSDLLE
jgi:hypothetical protein